MKKVTNEAYRSGHALTMSCQGDLTEYWVITQPIKEVSPSPLVGEGARRAGEGFFRGFTLIELLVVVLIIGILAAVALPQYQVAVKKAQLARFMALVRTLVQAEQAHYLATGIYTSNLNDLDVSVYPIQENCKAVADGSRFECGTGKTKIVYGIYDGATSVQAGTGDIRYVQYFQKYADRKEDAILCFSIGTISRRACQALGPGREEVYPVSNSWEYIYHLNEF